MPGHGLCWPIKLFFSAPLQHSIMGFIFPLLCHLGFKWANVHHASWTREGVFSLYVCVCARVVVYVCVCVEGVLACEYVPVLCMSSKHLCAAVPVCLCVER